jgi:manganese transport protein
LPMIALIIFTGRRDIMGVFVNGKVTRAAALVGAGVVLMLNMVLIAQAIGLQIPGLSAAG